MTYTDKERNIMPKQFLDLQLFSDEGVAETGSVADSVAENPVGDTGEQVATADGETWDSLIKGKYKDDYDKAIKGAIDRRFKNQRDLQGQINAIDPMMRALAQRYDIQADASGNIPIEMLTQKVLDDNSLYEQEAFQRGMSVEDLKQMKSLERENEMLRANQQRSAEQEEWDGLVAQAEALKQLYPNMDIDREMENPMFGRLLATMQRSGFPNAVQAAYEAVHREEVMGNAMQYAVQQTQQKISNSIASGMSRPTENGSSQQSPGAPTSIDPSRLTKAQLDDIKARAQRGERILF